MSYFETNLAKANSYYRVTKGFVVHELVDHRPSNSYYGASQIYEPVYKPLRLRRGNRILNLVGGLFVADKPGAPCRPVVLAVNDKHPFEKRYFPDQHSWPLDKLEPVDKVPYVSPKGGK